MKPYEERLADAQGIYAEGLRKVRTTKPPKGQKFPPGTRVHICKIGKDSSMGHFENDCDGTVEYTYAHAYGGDCVTEYSINIDGVGSVAWYYERQLTKI